MTRCGRCGGRPHQASGRAYRCWPCLRAEYPGRPLSAAVDAWQAREREREREARKGAGSK